MSDMSNGNTKYFCFYCLTFFGIQHSDYNVLLPELPWNTIGLNNILTLHAIFHYLKAIPLIPARQLKFKLWNLKLQSFNTELDEHCHCLLTVTCSENMLSSPSIPTSQVAKPITRKDIDVLLLQDIKKKKYPPISSKCFFSSKSTVSSRCNIHHFLG